MSALPIIVKQELRSVGLFTYPLKLTLSLYPPSPTNRERELGLDRRETG
jgi:hypothetical protein